MLDEKKPGGEKPIRECVFVLLTLFARIYLEENAEYLMLEWKKQTALHCVKYLHNHFDEPLTLENVARRFAMSKTSFCLFFARLQECPSRNISTAIGSGKVPKCSFGEIRLQRLQEGAAFAISAPFTAISKSEWDSRLPNIKRRTKAKLSVWDDKKSTGQSGTFCFF